MEEEEEKGLVQSRNGTGAGYQSRVEVGVWGVGDGPPKQRQRFQHRTEISHPHHNIQMPPVMLIMIGDNGDILFFSCPTCSTVT